MRHATGSRDCCFRYSISYQAGVDLGFRHVNSNELVHISGSSSGDQFSVRFRGKCHPVLPMSCPMQVSFSCESVHTASRLVQDLAQAFGITALSCEADFPKDLEALRQLLVQVADYNANRVTLSTDMADMCNMVKERVVKAEDCRIILDIARARAAYVEIQDINLKLRQQYTKRETNHNQLLACLKVRPLCRCSFASFARLGLAVLLFLQTSFDCYATVASFTRQEVNRVISRFAALRIGAAATKLTAAARQGQHPRPRLLETFL